MQTIQATFYATCFLFSLLFSLSIFSLHLALPTLPPTSLPHLLAYRVSVLMIVSLTVGPGRCQKKPALLWSHDPVFADLKPSSSFPPDKTLMVCNKFKCAAQCSNTPWCSSFFFTEGTGTCDLYKTVFTEKDRLVPSAGTAYFRIHSGELLPLKSNAQFTTNQVVSRLNTFKGIRADFTCPVVVIS